jgi:hypothetical protein
MLPFLVLVLFAFYIQGVQKFKCQIPVPKGEVRTLEDMLAVSVKAQGALREITECLSEEYAVHELISSPVRYVTSAFQIL